MTICIAAIHSNKTIITASDKKISFGGFFSTEGEMCKYLPVTDWIGLFAGEDISPAVRVLEDLQGRAKPNMSIEDFSVLCRDAYRKQRIIGIESHILGKYGMTLDEFKQTGKAVFTEDVYEHVFKEIDDYELKVQFLFGGFSPDCAPHIFTLLEPGTTNYFDRTGYWAIGSGKHAAVSHLASYPYQRTDSIAVCIYRVMAAKMAAETAREVGKNTYVSLRFRGLGIVIDLSEKMMAEIRRGYESLPRIPAGLEQSISAELTLAMNHVKRDKSIRESTGICFPTSWLAEREAVELFKELEAKKRDAEGSAKPSTDAASNNAHPAQKREKLQKPRKRSTRQVPTSSEHQKSKD